MDSNNEIPRTLHGHGPADWHDAVSKRFTKAGQWQILLESKIEVKINILDVFNVTTWDAVNEWLFKWWKYTNDAENEKIFAHASHGKIPGDDFEMITLQLCLEPLDQVQEFEEEH